MAGFIYFTEEQKRRANEVNLESFLLRQGERLLKSGREKRLASDHSITVRGNQWYDHAIEKGGGAHPFCKNVLWERFSGCGDNAFGWRAGRSLLFGYL